MLFVPLDRLPGDENERHALLRTYFCDKDALATRNGDDWELNLAWSADKARHVDPSLDVGLRWWGRDVHLGSMAQARWREGKILTALYDTWTLHGWSEWLSKAGRHPPGDVVVLHVDDHRDLGSPRLFVRDGALVDAITDQEVDIYAPTTVERAIQSGAIGMGSFMTPFLHLVPNAEVRHLCQPPKTTETQHYGFRATTDLDTLLQVGSLRPSIQLQKETAGLGTYLVSSDLDTWLNGIGDHSVLLHIDMDYFNNRYDGDSDWRARPNVLDPDSLSVAQKIDALVTALERHGLGPRIEDVTIAFSPGFFPAELWQAADERLRSGLRSLL